jgi:hypothetical protein
LFFESSTNAQGINKKTPDFLISFGHPFIERLNGKLSFLLLISLMYQIFTSAILPEARHDEK